MNKNLIIAIVVILGLGIGGFLVFQGGGGEISDTGRRRGEAGDLTPAQVSGNFVRGEEAPDAVFTDFEGNEHNLSDYKGKVVILDYWASWCPPCRLEMPILQDAHERYKDDIVMVGVHRTDTESKEAGRRFADSLEITYLLAVDPDDSLYSAATATSFAGMPVSVFINKEGVVDDIKVGAKTESEIKEKIGDLTGN